MPEPIRAYVVAVDPSGREISQRIPGAIHLTYSPGEATATFLPDQQTSVDIELDAAVGTIIADVECRRQDDDETVFDMGARAVRAGGMLTVISGHVEPERQAVAAAGTASVFAVAGLGPEAEAWDRWADPTEAEREDDDA